MSEWVFGWMSRGWKKKEGPILNLELWMDAVESVRGHQVSWQWVRGHEGHPQNEYANYLATRAAREQTSSGRHRGVEVRRMVGGGTRAGQNGDRAAGVSDGERFRATRPYPVIARPTLIT